MILLNDFPIYLFYNLFYFLIWYSYKHAIDGLYRILREEGPVKLFSGATMASSRAIFVTIGQVNVKKINHVVKVPPGDSGAKGCEDTSEMFLFECSHYLWVSPPLSL